MIYIFFPYLKEFKHLDQRHSLCSYKTVNGHFCHPLSFSTASKQANIKIWHCYQNWLWNKSQHWHKLHLCNKGWKKIPQVIITDLHKARTIKRALEKFIYLITEGTRTMLIIAGETALTWMLSFARSTSKFFVTWLITPIKSRSRWFRICNSHTVSTFF